MELIDLTKQSDRYKIITFPDGEVHLELAELNRKESVNIRCRITSSNDLFILMQLSDILKRQCVEVECFDILYLMGMRCDRLFDVNRPFTLRIVADVINSFGANKVWLYEPHSERSVSMIKNSHINDVTEAISYKLATEKNELLFVAPDKGALSRYDSFTFSVVCKKVREESNGKLLDFNVEEKFPVNGRDLLMLDDLCDGGGTFVGLAPKIRELNPKSLSLLVTHAIQKQGIERVSQVYDNVYITNTYKEWGEIELPDNVKVFRC